MAREKLDYIPWLPKAKPSDLFPYAYDLKLVNTIEELKKIIADNQKYEKIGFDTETTGLNQEELDIVGCSICYDGITAYYIPINHYTGGLGDEAIDLVYNEMLRCKIVYMFNMRYDCRVMEYIGFKDLFNAIESSDATEEVKDLEKVKLSYKAFYKYDMTKINTIDVQAMVFLVDTNVKYPSLKASEEWYLGWRGASFEQTVMKAQNENAVTYKKNTKTGEMEIKNMNFYYLTPEEAYEYASIDALGTFLLGEKLMPFLEEAKMSGQLDVQCLMPLLRFENELTLIDTDRLRQYSKYYEDRINEVQNRCWQVAGHEFNLGSSRETGNVLKQLNIHTGVTTKNGSMSTSKDSIAKCLEKLSKDDPARQFLEDITAYSGYVKQKSSFVDNLLESAESNKFHKNRLRFSYKTTEVPSGRLASGGDKKNTFFFGGNIQQQPKPHVCDVFCVPEEAISKYYPEINKLLNESGTREECTVPLTYCDSSILGKYLEENGIESYNITGNRECYRIYKWVFSNKPWLIPDVEEYVAEGFIQDQNIRSCFLPDDNTYWVSLDFNAEEIRIPALWSKEPVWCEAFSSGDDIHKRTAYAIFGKENYTKDKRKLAKRS